MKLATTTGGFLPWVKTTAEAVRLYEGTGFRHLDYSFYKVIHPGSPFLGDRWLDEVEDAGREAARLGMDFVQAHSPNYNPLDPDADHAAGMLATLRSIEACGRLGILNIVVHPGVAADLDYPGDREEFFRRNLVFFRSLFPAMEKWNVNVLVENSAEKNEIYKARFAEAFNLATLPFYWKDLEPERGKPRYAKDSPRVYRRPSPDLCVEWCESNGIEPKEHCLNYPADYTCPDWAKGEVQKEKAFLEKRFRELAERYAGRIPMWEVTNELLVSFRCGETGNRFRLPRASS